MGRLLSLHGERRVAQQHVVLFRHLKPPGKQQRHKFRLIEAPDRVKSNLVKLDQTGNIIRLGRTQLDRS